MMDDMFPGQVCETHLPDLPGHSSWVVAQSRGGVSDEEGAGQLHIQASLNDHWLHYGVSWLQQG